MFFVEVLFAVAFALAIAFSFVMVVGRARPSRSGTALPFVWLFVILLFTMWAGGDRVRPAARRDGDDRARHVAAPRGVQHHHVGAARRARDRGRRRLRVVR
jgi:hypothetical protein